MPFNEPAPDAYDFLINRRSVKTRDMVEPGPGHATIRAIMAAAMRVPDHGKLAPWRFILLDSKAQQEKLGDLIETSLLSEGDVSDDTAAKMAGYATQAPLLIVAVYSPSDTKKAIPKWEQQLSTGAACQNLINAVHAKGFVAQWLTGWAASSADVMRGLGLTGGERIAGFIFIGSMGRVPSERPRPSFEDRVTIGMPR